MDSTVAVSSDENAEVARSIVPVVAPVPPPVVEKDPPITPAAGGADDGSKVVRSVVRRWKREDLLEKAGLVLRALAWVFSLVAVALLASNKQGGWMNFDRYQEYRYLLSVAAIAMVYSMVQLLRQAHRFMTGKDLAPLTYSWTFDFAGDQVMAYLLISASSAAIPITDRMRREVVNSFTDISVVAINRQDESGKGLAAAALPHGQAVSRPGRVLGRNRGLGRRVSGDSGDGDGGVEVLPDLGDYPIRGDGPGVDPGGGGAGAGALGDDGGAEGGDSFGEESELGGGVVVSAGEHAHHVLVLRRAMEPPLDVGGEQLLHPVRVATVQGFIEGEHSPLVAVLQALSCAMVSQLRTSPLGSLATSLSLSLSLRKRCARWVGSVSDEWRRSRRRGIGWAFIEKKLNTYLLFFTNRQMTGYEARREGVKHDSHAMAMLKTKTEFSKDACAIHEWVLTREEEALKGKSKPGRGGDDKIYKGSMGTQITLCSKECRFAKMEDAVATLIANVFNEGCSKDRCDGGDSVDDVDFQVVAMCEDTPEPPRKGVDTDTALLTLKVDGTMLEVVQPREKVNPLEANDVKGFRCSSSEIELLDLLFLPLRFSPLRSPSLGLPIWSLRQQRRRAGERLRFGAILPTKTSKHYASDLSTTFLRIWRVWMVSMFTRSLPKGLIHDAFLE
ncbi:hypothetical protein ZIOFF_066176 [Zingiber officinale]|uniref:Casparian strip membrane protein domain-containing protein n=1 Tax=Zingiber officinale TaxID=94328 RepID=A0A8J5KDM7_ZINOF|nr:hypothetical protein ZIOFF_066176 [Zingiber officinale]